MATKEDLIISKIDDLKESTDQRLDSIDVNLAAHMKRTDILEKLHMDNQTRIGILEEPAKALQLIKSVVVYFAAISASIISVIKLLEYLP